MKKRLPFKLFLLTGILMFSNITFIDAQTTLRTDTLTVSGDCGGCRDRIEEAAFIKGVRKAHWEQKTQVLTISFKPDKTSLEKIAKSLAEAGYDSRLQNANETAYSKLPSCCHYRSKSK